MLRSLEMPCTDDPLPTTLRLPRKLLTRLESACNENYSTKILLPCRAISYLLECLVATFANIAVTLMNQSFHLPFIVNLFSILGLLLPSPANSQSTKGLPLNAEVLTMAVSGNGDLYVGGEFTNGEGTKI